MKSKQFNKKLVLKKNTIANLDNKGMASVYGGEEDTYVKTVCFTDCATNCFQCPTMRPSICPILC